ncbi:hypothetical protein [Staphylococcus saprophyticus]|uniref:hypothetical protein n=1 Tax=Staphylococcus saprophyticus TaxID=29385 RepID=UPI0008536918|nr:hypothetical protein [Staphylococcus saprophyticus]OEK44591.1 hypothetical protein ASS92_10995 [Staphylococcus saprophyticus]
MNLWGNLDEDKLDYYHQIVNKKFFGVYYVLKLMSNDVLKEWGLDKEIEYNDESSFFKALKFQIGDEKVVFIRNVQRICADIINTYCKILVHRDNIKGMYELTNDYKVEKYWFEYNAQYAIRLISTLNDYLYRYINLVNQFEIKPKATFKNDVVKKLKEYKKRNVVVALGKNSSLLDNYRNNITHNYNVFINGALKVTKEKNSEFVGREKNDINSINQFINDFEEFIIFIVLKYKKVYKENSKDNKLGD